MAAQERAEADQKEAKERFKSWAERYVPGARHMNVCSGAQIRQLLFANIPNNKDDTKQLEDTRKFKVRLRSPPRLHTRSSPAGKGGLCRTRRMQFCLYIMYVASVRRGFSMRNA